MRGLGRRRRVGRTCSWGSTTGTTAPWCGSPTASAVISTADFFTPVVDDAYDFGRIVAANALSDVYAMGGRPVLAINLVGWPRSVLPLELLREVLRGGLDVAAQAGLPRRRRAQHRRPRAQVRHGRDRRRRPGSVAAQRLCAARAADLASPSRSAWACSTTGTRPRARCSRTRSRRWSRSTTSRARRRWRPGCEAATDVTGFGLLGHLFKLLRASGVGAVLDAAAVPVPRRRAGRRCATGYVSGGTRRNLDWVRPHLDARRRRGGAAHARRRPDQRRAARRRRGAGRAGHRPHRAPGPPRIEIR